MVYFVKVVGLHTTTYLMWSFTKKLTKVLFAALEHKKSSHGNIKGNCVSNNCD